MSLPTGAGEEINESDGEYGNNEKCLIFHYHKIPCSFSESAPLLFDSRLSKGNLREF
jgi:hypothetical protein